MRRDGHGGIPMHIALQQLVLLLHTFLPIGVQGELHKDATAENATMQVMVVIFSWTCLQDLSVVERGFCSHFLVDHAGR